MARLANLLQISGVTAAVVAGFTISVTVGLVVLAIALTAIGIALEPSKPQPPAKTRREF